MLFCKGKSFFEYRKLKKIARQVRNGIVPDGVSKDRIFEALKVTRPSNVFEMFGFLHAVVHNPDGTLKKDYGLVSVKKVTTAFAIRLVDALMDSATTIATFSFHKMGSGSTSETAAQTALITQQVGAQTGTDGATAQTHGASSDIYRTVGTLTAGSAYGCREHGVFNASTGGVMLDRSVVTNIDLNTEDVVTWTYELTVNSGG